MTAGKNQFIRQNKNFLNHPMFAIDEITAKGEKHCWAPAEKFRMETFYKLPTKNRFRLFGRQTDPAFRSHMRKKSDIII